MGSRWTVLVAAIVTVSLLASACSDERDVPPDPRVSPESLTEALMLLWQARDREAADRLGTDAAMDALFGVTPPTVPLEVIECLDEPELPRAKTCLARGGGQRVLVTVEPSEAVDRWQAVAVLPVR